MFTKTAEREFQLDDSVNGHKVVLICKELYILIFDSRWEKS